MVVIYYILFRDSKFNNIISSYKIFLVMVLMIIEFFFCIISIVNYYYGFVFS